MRLAQGQYPDEHRIVHKDTCVNDLSGGSNNEEAKFADLEVTPNGGGFP